MISYRNILAGDYDQIEAFEEQREEIDAFIVEELEDMFGSTGNNFTENNFATYFGLVACIGDEIVGYLIGFKLNQFPTKLAVLRCFVAPEYRRQGIGSQLIQRVEPTESGHRVSTEVSDVDYASAAFLRKNGYTVIEVVEAEYNEEGEKEMDGFMILVNEKKARMSLTQRLTWRAK